MVISLKYSHVIWDWNGTLLNDVETNLCTANVMLAKRNLPVIESEELYRKMFRFPVIEFYRLAGFDLNEENFAVMAEEYVKTYRENSYKSRLFDDSVKIIGTFDDVGISQVILSATEQTRLRAEVASYGVAEHFAEILGVGDNLGSSKSARGRAYTETLTSGRAVFIGDTAHDADVARECGCDCVLVSRGHMDRSRLKETGCPVFHSLTEAAGYILE